MRVHETVGQPGSVGKQVLDGHRRDRLFGDEPFVVAPIEYLELGPRLDVFGHRVVELEAPFLVEHHERRTRNRLGHRIKTEHGVALHPPAAVHVRKSGLVEERFLTTARYQAHCARVLALVHVAVDMRRDAPQPVRRKAVGHPSLSPSLLIQALGQHTRLASSMVTLTTAGQRPPERATLLENTGCTRRVWGLWESPFRGLSARKGDISTLR